MPVAKVLRISGSLGVQWIFQDAPIQEPLNWKEGLSYHSILPEFNAEDHCLLLKQDLPIIAGMENFILKCTGGMEFILLSGSMKIF